MYQDQEAPALLEAGGAERLERQDQDRAERAEEEMERWMNRERSVFSQQRRVERKKW
jgi:hypothetical protein